MINLPAVMYYLVNHDNTLEHYLPEVLFSTINQDKSLTIIFKVLSFTDLAAYKSNIIKQTKHLELVKSEYIRTMDELRDFIKEHGVLKVKDKLNSTTEFVYNCIEFLEDEDGVFGIRCSQQVKQG